MKSEFSLAFNQICAEYGLPREVVLDAVRAAMVTAYRRDWKIASTQNVTADISLETGLARIYLEKAVVDAVEDEVTEIGLKTAQRIKPDAELDDVVMVDVTPNDFGRIAAQTAKQVITQRLREAERESQFNRFSRQENEIIIGTVQSINPHGVTLHLERTEEARMPRREQIPGERYTLHQKIRVYVLEVKRTPRGPEIIVSRSHPLMLRRLLELEVPEIRTGQVELKAVAREAGTRAKVAVMTRQPGLDPVGACVGMRGIRIQTISRELHGERIDVVEWNQDSAQFVANALSMKRVISVSLDEHNAGGRTASVVVLDDHLSLAIGRSGQNARLAAKLTGWRVDIQGVTEAALWALEQVNANPNLVDDLRTNAALIPRLASVMQTHEKDRYPYTDEELTLIKKVVESVRQVVLARREAERPAARQARERRSARERAEAERMAAKRQARATVPKAAYERDLQSLELSEKVYGHLINNGLKNVGEVMERVAIGDEALLMLKGVGSKALLEIKEAVDAYDLAFVEMVAEEAEETVSVAEETPLVEAEEVAVAEATQVEEITAEEIPVAAAAEEAVAAEEAPVAAAVEEAAAAEEAIPPVEELVAEEVTAPVEEEAAPAPAVLAQEEAPAVAEEVTAEAEEEAQDATPTVAEPELVGGAPGELAEQEEGEDDFEADIFTEAVEKFTRRYVDVTEEEEVFPEVEQGDSKDSKGSRKKPRTVIYDDETGETFVVRRRRRNQDPWDSYIDDY